MRSRTSSSAMSGVLTVVSLLVLFAGGSARASTGPVGTPGDCPNLVAVPGGYRLEADTACDARWDEDGTTLDLGGHTYTGNLRVAGEHQTLRHGRFRTDHQFWVTPHLTISGVVLSPSGQSTGGFAIEVGSYLTMENCTVRDFAGVALSFFHGGPATVRSSRFLGNGYGISVQKADDITIENNLFLRNGVGVRLWDEDGVMVDRNTVRGNLFRGNVDVGIMLAGWLPGGSSFEDNTVTRNRIEGTGGAGIRLLYQCDRARSSCGTGSTGNITGNVLVRNGWSPPRESSGNDGVTATLTEGSRPDGLRGVRLAGNVALLNADLGLDVEGVTDGGHNLARFNRNPAQCSGVRCGRSAGAGTGFRTG